MPGTSFSPLPIYAAAFLAGVSTLFSMPSLKTAWILFAVASALYTLLLVHKRWRLPVFLFLGGFAWAGLFTACQLSLTVPQELAGKDILVEGYIEGLAEAEGQVVRFTFNALRSDSIDGKKIEGRARVRDYRQHAIDPRPGEAWRLLLRVNPPHGFSNPAGFDYEKWLFSQRIVATAYIRNEKAGNNAVNNDYHQVNHRLPELDRPAMIDRMRLDLGSQINRRLAESSYSGIITALTTGDRRASSSQQWSVLQ